jgi:heme exporter protein B
LLLGTIGFLAVGNVFVVIGQKSRLQEVMLPVLLLPVLSPLILGLVEATAIILASGPRGDLISWLQLIIAFDILFLGVGFLLYGQTLED